MPERKGEKRSILKKVLGTFSRNEQGSMNEEETVPLISMEEFNRLMDEVDWIQISRGGNYDNREAVTSFNINAQEIKDISQKSRDFLKISEGNSENTSLLFSLHHYEGIQARVVVQNKERRIQYLFDVERASCVASFQTLRGESWEVNPEVVHSLPDIEKVLKAGRKAKDLIDRPSSP